jgi:hypothetical protein
MGIKRRRILLDGKLPQWQNAPKKSLENRNKFETTFFIKNVRYLVITFYRSISPLRLVCISETYVSSAFSDD